MQIEESYNGDMPGMSMAGGVPSRDMYAGAIKDLTNPFKQLHTIEQQLRGLRRIDGKWKNVAQPLLNEVGINAVMTRMQAYLTTNTTMTDIKDLEIRNIIHEISYELVADLMINRKAYGIKNSEHRTRITKMLIIPVFLALKRSSEGGERRFWKGSLSENINYNQQPAKRGFLGWRR